MSNKKNIVILLLLSLFITSFLNASTINNTKNEDSNKLPYKFLTDYQIKYLKLENLIIHRAEVYAARGYEFENQYLLKKMKQKSWYKPSSSFSYSSFTDEERKYVSKLNKRINKLKKLKLITLRRNLQRSLTNNFVIKFSKLADLNNDGYFDIIAICGKKFKLLKNQQIIGDEAYYHYYNNPNELYLVAYGRSYYGRFFSKIKLNQKEFGTAEYVNAFHTGYYLGNGKPQIKIVLHSFPLKNFTKQTHQQNLYIFNLENSKLVNIFSHETYHFTVTGNGNEEKIIEYSYHFENINDKNKWKELCMVKKSKSIKYYYTRNSGPNYSEKLLYKSKPFCFEYNDQKKLYVKSNK